MNTDLIQGIITGMVLGSTFAWLQILAIRQREAFHAGQTLKGWLKLVPGSMTRCAILLAGLVAAQVYLPNADKYWLAGSLIVCSSLPMIYRLAQLRRQRL